MEEIERLLRISVLESELIENRKNIISTLDELFKTIEMTSMPELDVMVPGLCNMYNKLNNG